MADITTRQPVTDFSVVESNAPKMVGNLVYDATNKKWVRLNSLPTTVFESKLEVTNTNFNILEEILLVLQDNRELLQELNQ